MVQGGQKCHTEYLWSDVQSNHMGLTNDVILLIHKCKSVQLSDNIFVPLNLWNSPDVKYQW